MISAQEVRRLFIYDYCTGLLYNRFCRGYQAPKGARVGWVDDSGYRRTKIRGQTYFIHKLIWLYNYDAYPEEIDHWDGNKGNNLLGNLRVATRSQNLANTEFPTGVSGIKGVKLNSERSKWRSMIQRGGQRYFLGDFDTKEEAAQAYKEAAERLFGEYALHNRPQT